MSKSYRCAGCGNTSDTLRMFPCGECGCSLLTDEPTMPVNDLQKLHDDFSDSSIESFYELLEAIKLLVEDHR